VTDILKMKIEGINVEIETSLIDELKKLNIDAVKELEQVLKKEREKDAEEALRIKSDG
jgi:post-segregation antitoxin (ccd killing protein)